MQYREYAVRGCSKAQIHVTVIPVIVTPVTNIFAKKIPIIFHKFGSYYSTVLIMGVSRDITSVRGCMIITIQFPSTIKTNQSVSNTKQKAKTQKQGNFTGQGRTKAFTSPKSDQGWPYFKEFQRNFCRRKREK